ncbi:hypothetical protein COLO4_20633 [Corchorus olitorius]|uniref:Uncharacterized protein n=1 Tax=Corchorus olitorius TaxID=93759 RepID=A0A1R3IYG7_9ROSI|nr:hypothetical protein COLO4_20633 [Corchorus olitorius]
MNSVSKGEVLWDKDQGDYVESMRAMSCRIRSDQAARGVRWRGMMSPTVMEWAMDYFTIVLNLVLIGERKLGSKE